ncbi:isoflavone reductase like protein pcber [Quercus suber]|uniref:Isoflavone reductase like protein pcber n=1 Tax=Quercus suber TaxID=58331 RepID=A0AAW0J847_QUESU
MYMDFPSFFRCSSKHIYVPTLDLKTGNARDCRSLLETQSVKERNVKYQSLGSLNKSLVGDKLVTTAARPATVQCRKVRKLGTPTFAWDRENTASNPEKSKLIESFKSSGMTLLHGDIYRHESLVKAIKQVDIVISAVGSKQIADQRFIPSEFGTDVDRVHAVEPAAHFSGVRISIEAEAIPMALLGATAPPRGEVVIIGDGNPIGIFVKEEDIVNYTIKAVDDPRTLNKVLYLKTPANNLSFNEIVSLWEKKIGKTLEKIYLLEDQLLKKIQETYIIYNEILRFFPSEFGVDVDCAKAVDPVKHHLGVKASIRRFIVAEGIPYTYIVSNGFAGYFLPNFGNGLTSATAPPRDKVEIIGEGNPKIVSIWEKKIGKTLEKTYLLEDQLLKKIQESSCPFNLLLSIAHSAFVKGNLTNSSDRTCSVLQIRHSLEAAWYKILEHVYEVASTPVALDA